jgi:adenine-specific DNA-methyltransferase
LSHEGTTAYHARYFAHDLTLRKPAADADRLSASLFNATVDLNPHQIDAALFALKSPLSKGVILADEVGLGKTIEAALILCQLWAEGRRRLLVVCPASIRKQWSLELEEKFNLPTVILDSVAFRRAQADGNPAPFLADAIVITSLNFASAMQTDVRAVQWDVVVIDEAHKLRNAYRPSNQMGQRLRWALENRRKVLLTATPLQNSLLELYGLSTVIDEHIFGDVGSFRSQYMRQDSDLKELRERLAGFCKRTLRNQVTEYIQYTERHPITRPFQPTEGEHKFYEAVSAFLLREDTYSIPVRQRALTTLILRKLLASSSPAIAGTLETMKERLEKIRDGQPAEDNLAEQIIALEELEDDYLDETLDLPEYVVGEQPVAVAPKIDLAKLKMEIAELFMLDQADLDFGIYRVMNAKRAEVTRFLDHDLLPQVRTELEKIQTGDRAGLETELAKAIAAARAAGFSAEQAEQSPKVKELRAQLAATVDVSALENEVLSDLANFFRRYYSGGDFLALRRYKAGVYAIPYEGEEVKLHWANADQYYIKTSEFLRDYTFKLADGKRIHFKLVEADTEADNKKSAAGQERRFILGADEPLLETDGELVIRFEYRPDADKRKQAELNTLASATILNVPGFTAWKSALARFAPTEKNPNRTLLEKHLGDYTARNSFDYFIHKDIGGFLRRELDFYIKNEIMHLDDIEAEDAPRVGQYLAKIKAIRAIARKIIDFLEQLENFQKKLWLKKKFVVETNYCVTLDRVAEALYPEIAANDAQRAEWVKLFAIDEIKAGTPAPVAKQGELISASTAKSQTPTPGYSVPLAVEFLKANPFLVLDTKFFPEEFKERLLADDKILGGAATLDAATNGLIIHGENFHALSLLQARFRGQVKCIYIDPPYNTGSDGFCYKDTYQHSSWLAMMESRLARASAMLTDGGSLFTSVDDHEYVRLAELQALQFGCSPEATIVRVNPSTKSWSQFLSTTHDYCVVSIKNPDAIARADKWAIKKPYVDEFKKRTKALLKMKLTDDEKRQNLREISKIPMFKAFDHYTEFDEKGVYRSGNPNRTLQSEGAIVYPNVLLIHPTSKKKCKISDNWRFDQDKTDEIAARKPTGFHFGEDETTVPGVKNYLDEYENMTPQSVMFDDTQVDTKTILPGMGLDFGFPKPLSFVRRILEMAAPPSSWCMDFFGGSGTTGHAVIDLNREDKGGRKYLLIEMGEHFDAVLKLRLQKLIYSKDWKGGKPVSREGSSHLFKYLRLESYEDALNNLELKRTEAQDDLLRQHAPLREDYLLRYQLDVESAGSASLLAVAQFANPFAYQLKIATGSVGESRAVNVDLVETFNYLLGLRVSHTDTLRGFKVVTGLNPAGEKTLVIWRNVAEKSNKELDDFFKKQEYNTKDMEFAVIYVNGDNNLENLKRADETWKVRRIEDEFKRLMFDVQDV